MANIVRINGKDIKDAFARNEVAGVKNTVMANIKPRNIIEGVLSANILYSDEAYILNPNVNSKIIYFPVTSGQKYTIYRGYAMTGTRIAYCDSVPKTGDEVTNYGALDGSAVYGTFTAAETGYCCAKVWQKEDDQSEAEIFGAIYAYAGEYNASLSKENSDIQNVLNLNSRAVADVYASVDNADEVIGNVSIVEGVLKARFDNGTTISSTSPERLIYFPVDSGKKYTVIRGASMSGCRVAYTNMVPAVGSSVANYSDVIDNNGNYATFTAAQNGYACIRIAWTGDMDSIVDQAYAYEGLYDTTKIKTSKNLVTEKINGFEVEREVSLTKGYYVVTKYAGQLLDLSMVGNTNLSCAIIGVKAEQVVRITGMPNDNSGTRPLCFANASGYSVYRHDVADRLTDYRYMAPTDGLVIVNLDNRYPYKVVVEPAGELATLKHLLKEPFTVLPKYILEGASYRTLGPLHHGYFCLVTDDGTEDGETGLATYTVPLAISKDIPITFAVASASDVFQNNTYKNAVLNAVNNYGCAISQHDVTKYWDTMSEEELYKFFESEEAFFNGLGVSVRSAVIPGHRTTSLVKAVAGGKYGVVRSGYNGMDSSFEGNDSVQNYYNYWTSGERSNVFGLSSYNCAGATDAYNQASVDYAKANNKIVIVYYHENDLDAGKKALIENMIDYAKAQGLTFITLDQIPYLETWEQ